MQLSAPIVHARDLLEHLDDPSLRLADVRWYLGKPDEGRRAYEAGHLPGAIFVDLDTDLAAAGPGRHPLPRPDQFRQRMEKLGIGDEHVVVAYDDVGGSVAARLWWMLDSLGHHEVAVLDGGIAAWREIGGPIVTEERQLPSANLGLAAAWARTIDCDALRARLGTVLLLDARAGERYRGEVEPVDPVAGHIPTAVSLPFAGNLDERGRFRSEAEIAQRFRGLGADERTVLYCGSGVNACHNALAMRLAGLPDPILYPGSYSDWSRSGMAIATGAEPGEP